MRWLSDDAVARLRQAADRPDLSGTRYTIREEIGRGGMGTVYLADDAALERPVALKVLTLEEGASQAESLLREARVMAKLEHPGLVPVHDAGLLPDGRVYYAMKFVAGERLDHYAASGRTLWDRLAVFQKICDAVAFAHARGVLHRDLKPENVMIGAFGEVLVMDWGVARRAQDPAEPGGTVVG
ncbi:MAG TPA: serine/threonine-protein kinase, partial [Thermoanaerobaculia bacterium]|nr:serine/threonine-protein kinase [Thermoanaerobaculia bacterium]